MQTLAIEMLPVIGFKLLGEHFLVGYNIKSLSQLDRNL